MSGDWTPKEGDATDETEPLMAPDDEDDDDENSMGYSDDSASLSDAYFFPQSDDDLARPGMRRQSQQQQQQYPIASYYGSMGERATSPLWVAGSIQEDAELQAAQYTGSDLRTAEQGMLGKKERRRQRKLQKHMQRMVHKQREQVARERAVTMVRGQPQELNSWQDSFFAVLFLVQLVVVILLALRFGFGVILFKDSSSWGPYIGPNGNFHWQHAHNRSLSSSNSTTSTANITTTHTNFSSLNTNAATDDYVDLSTQPSTAVYSDDSFTIDYKNVIALVGITGFYACVLTYLSFGFMLILARSLITIMLVFSIIVSLGWGMIGLTLDPYGIISIMGFSALLLTLGHVRCFGQLLLGMPLVSHMPVHRPCTIGIAFLLQPQISTRRSVRCAARPISRSWASGASSSPLAGVCFGVWRLWALSIATIRRIVTRMTIANHM